MTVLFLEGQVDCSFVTSVMSLQFFKSCLALSVDHAIYFSDDFQCFLRTDQRTNQLTTERMCQTAADRIPSGLSLCVGELTLTSHYTKLIRKKQFRDLFKTRCLQSD